MNGTVVVEVSRRVPHKLYEKILKISKRYKVATSGKKPEVGQIIKIVQTRPVAKDKHFAIFTPHQNGAGFIEAKKSTEPAVKAKTVKAKKEIKA